MNPRIREPRHYTDCNIALASRHLRRVFILTRCAVAVGDSQGYVSLGPPQICTEWLMSGDSNIRQPPAHQPKLSGILRLRRVLLRGLYDLRSGLRT
jgi:hypothetical protein